MLNPSEPNEVTIDIEEGVELAEPTRASEEGPAEHQAPVCTVGFCPICMVVTSAQPLKPEVIEHLLLAGREFLLAAKAILDARADHVADGGGGGSRNGKVRNLEKIDIG